MRTLLYQFMGIAAACCLLTACGGSTPSPITGPTSEEEILETISSLIEKTDLIGFWNYDSSAKSLSPIRTESRNSLLKTSSRSFGNGELLFAQSKQFIFSFDSRGKTVQTATLKDGRKVFVLTDGNVFVTPVFDHN